MRGRGSAAARWTCTHRSWVRMARDEDRAGSAVLGVRGADRVDPRGLWRHPRAVGARVRAPRARAGEERAASLPSLSLIVAAHDEQAVIAAKVRDALQLDYPRQLLEVIVACDGCSDATAELARGAGADLVLELPRGGKIRAQDA